jgi:hypothetical protein
MDAPSPPSRPAAAHPSSAELDLRFKVLSAEYGHLTSMLSSTWSNAAARANLFFVAVSAAGLALAYLVGGTGATRTSLVLVMVVLLLVLVIGLVALSRLLTAHRESTRLVQSMIRIRHFFVELDPGAAAYMTLPIHDDEAGLFGASTARSRFSAMTYPPAASMASLVAFVDAFVTAAIVGTAYIVVAGDDVSGAVAWSGVTLAIGLAFFQGWVFANLERLRRSLDVRFPQRD